MRRTLAGAAAAAAAIALLAGAAGAAPIQSRLGIKILGCQVVANGAVTNGVRVTYMNNRAMPVTEVDFRIHYRGAAGIVIDKGNFTQYAQIEHTLTNAFVGQAYQGPAPNLCRVNRIVLADGSVRVQ